MCLALGLIPSPVNSIDCRSSRKRNKKKKKKTKRTMFSCISLKIISTFFESYPPMHDLPIFPGSVLYLLILDLLCCAVFYP